MNNFILRRLFELRDDSYKDFQCSLMPSVDKATVIGVRTPTLRAFAKEIVNSCEAKDFLSRLPHTYYEENNLHAFLIEHIKDYRECISALNEFLPHVNNWATCDSMTPKVLKKHPEELLCEIDKWLSSSHVYTVRYAIRMLMCFYLGDNFSLEYPNRVSMMRSDEYYVKMMVAWYFATALAHQYNYVIPYIEDNVLDTWTHNKTIQKAVESYRISEAQKEHLKTLRKKNI